MYSPLQLLGGKVCHHFAPKSAAAGFSRSDGEQNILIISLHVLLLFVAHFWTCISKVMVLKQVCPQPDFTASPEYMTPMGESISIGVCLMFECLLLECLMFWMQSLSCPLGGSPGTMMFIVLEMIIGGHSTYESDRLLMFDIIFSPCICLCVWRYFVFLSRVFELLPLVVNINVSRIPSGKYQQLFHTGFYFGYWSNLKIRALQGLFKMYAASLSFNSHQHASLGCSPRFPPLPPACELLL